LIFSNQVSLLFKKVLTLLFLTFNNLFLWLNIHKMIRLVIELVLYLSKLRSYLRLLKSFNSKLMKIIWVVKAQILHNCKVFLILWFSHKDIISNKMNQLWDQFLIRRILTLLYRPIKRILILPLKMLRDLWWLGYKTVKWLMNSDIRNN